MKKRGKGTYIMLGAVLLLTAFCINSTQASADVGYIDPANNDISWNLIESDGEETVTFERTGVNTWLATITPTDKLTPELATNYKVNSYYSHLELVEDNPIEVKRESPGRLSLKSRGVVALSGFAGNVDIKTDQLDFDLKNYNQIEIVIPSDVFGGGTEAFTVGFGHTTSYSAVTNTILVTGVGETFETVYQDDILNGWGVVTRQGTRQFHFDCALEIGDGVITTEFIDSACQVVFSGTALRGGLNNILLKSKATLQLGLINDEATKTTKAGVDIIFDDQTDSTHYSINCTSSTTAILKLYSVSMKRTITTVGWTASIIYAGDDGSRIWNCLFPRGIYINEPRSGLDVYNTTIQNSGYGVRNLNQGVTFDDFKIQSCTYGFLTGSSASGTYVARNVDLIDNLTNFLYVNQNDADFHFINCASSPDWSVRYNGACGGKWLRQYTLDLLVTDINGNPLNGCLTELNTQGGTLAFSTSTSASGTISEQIVTYYEEEGGFSVVTGSATHSPHTLTITRNGYRDYQTVFTIDKPQDLTIALEVDDSEEIDTDGLIAWMEANLTPVDLIPTILLIVLIILCFKLRYVWLMIVGGIGVFAISLDSFNESPEYSIPYAIIGLGLFVMGAFNKKLRRGFK